MGEEKDLQFKDWWANVKKRLCDYVKNNHNILQELFSSDNATISLNETDEEELHRNKETLKNLRHYIGQLEGVIRGNQSILNRDIRNRHNTSLKLLPEPKRADPLRGSRGRKPLSMPNCKDEPIQDEIKKQLEEYFRNFKFDYQTLDNSSLNAKLSDKERKKQMKKQQFVYDRNANQPSA